MVGGISRIKGYRRLVECAQESLKRNLPVEFIVVGHTENDAALSTYSNVTVTGRYEQRHLHALLDEVAPDVVLFLNEIPETFSYTLTTAFEGGLWPIVTGLGVPAERVKSTGFGTVLPVGLPVEELLEKVMMIASEQRKDPAAPPVLKYPRTLAEYRG